MQGDHEHRWEESARRAGAFAPAARCARALVIVAIALALVACSDDPPTESQAPARAETPKPAAHRQPWLKVTDGMPPEQWLASREAGRDLDQYEPAVADMRRVLEVAAARFRDQPRMIANRAVQLEGMLGEKDIAERAPRLIVTLSQVPGPHRSIESFSALTQQYYNLRVEGLGQGPAIDTLKQRFERTLPEANAR
jgi:hypothetical protein